MPLSKAKEIQSNYSESFEFLQERKKRQVNQIVLLNNLQRGDENIASTLLITLFNRIMSNTYDNKLGVKFILGEEMEQKQVNSINILQQNDYREMDKDKLDYDWTWDTLFFGNGWMETLRFDTKRKIMKPCVINPLVFGYDPFFEEVQDWRYYWKWKILNKWQVWKLIKNGTIIGITDPKEIPSGVDPSLWDYKVTREQAKRATPQANDTYQGDVFQILEFFSYNSSGEKCVYWTDRDISKILYYEKLDLRDADNGKDSKWPIIRKQAFKEPHSTVNFSVADILEDKHRARSVLLNLAFIAAKDKANPLYTYNPDLVIDPTQLFSRQINQHIPVKDKDAINPLNTQNPMDSGLMAFMQMLNQEANDPMGTGMSLNPTKKGKQTAAEASIQQQLNDLAQSLQSKVMQFGEEEFWADWYQRYKRHTKAGDEKIASIVGSKGVTFNNIDLGDIHTKYPPGIIITSTKDAEYKELVLRRDLTQLRGDFANTWTPDALRSFDKYVLLPKYLQDPSLVEVLLPKTLDEINAEAENEMFVDSLPPVKETDNHEQHLAVHYMAPNTWGKWIHIQWHQELLGLQKKQQMDQAQEAQQPDKKGGDQKPPGEGGGANNKGGKPQFSNQQKDPNQATPLKAEMNSQPK